MTKSDDAYIAMLEIKSRVEAALQISDLAQAQKRTIVKDWYIVELFNVGSSSVGRVLWGIIVKDETGRWRESDYVCTSLIESINGDEVTTRNSLYVLGSSNNGAVRLPLSSIMLLKSGFDPEMVQLIIGESE